LISVSFFFFLWKNNNKNTLKVRKSILIKIIVEKLIMKCFKNKIIYLIKLIIKCFKIYIYIYIYIYLLSEMMENINFEIILLKLIDTFWYF